MFKNSIMTADSNAMLVTLTIGDIVNVIREVVCECLDNSQQQEEIASEGEQLITASKAMKLLKCNRSTLWRWNRDKYLCTVKVGKKNFYKQTDIQNIINSK